MKESGEELKESGEETIEDGGIEGTLARGEISESGGSILDETQKIDAPDQVNDPIPPEPVPEVKINPID